MLAQHKASHSKITAADLRALIARAAIPHYIIAAHARIHPQRLSDLLRERRPLAEEIADRIFQAIRKLEVGDAQ